MNNTSEDMFFTPNDGALICILMKTIEKSNFKQI